MGGPKFVRKLRIGPLRLLANPHGWKKEKGYEEREIRLHYNITAFFPVNDVI